MKCKLNEAKRLKGKEAKRQNLNLLTSSPFRLFTFLGGFTLIELIIFIVLAGIILPLIFIPFMTGLKSYSTPEIVSTATFLGEELMEEIKSKRFDEKTTSPFTNPGSLGPDGGDRDDVDDYIGSQPPAAPFGDYSRSVTVFYVSADNLDVNDEVNPTSYKRIQVTVTNSQIPNVVMATLVSNN